MTTIDYVLGILGFMVLPVVCSWLWCKITMIGE
jgi:hypothetical protein